jgi:hypothetical protein
MSLNFINLLGYIDHKYVSFLLLRGRRKKKEKKKEKKTERKDNKRKKKKEKRKDRKIILSPKCY